MLMMFLGNCLPVYSILPSNLHEFMHAVLVSWDILANSITNRIDFISGVADNRYVSKLLYSEELIYCSFISWRFDLDDLYCRRPRK